MAHRAVAGRLRGVGVGKSKELSDQRLTVLWLRPHCRAIDRTECPFRRSRTYRRTSCGVTRLYEGCLRSRDVGLRRMPRSFRGLRPSMRVSALETSRWFIGW